MSKVTSKRACDVERVNEVVRSAVETWHLPARVQRLGMPALLYRKSDLEFMSVVMATDSTGRPIGVALWEEVTGQQAVPFDTAAFLHGLYVVQDWHGEGLGCRLLDVVNRFSKSRRLAGITLKAWRESADFFSKRGFAIAERDKMFYPLSMWRKLA